MLSFLRGPLEMFFGLTARCEPLVKLLARISVGFVFYESGLGKLRGLDKVIEFFTSLGIPFPQIQAPMVASLEFLGGILLMLGLGTRVVTIPLTVIMLVALRTAHWDEVEGLTSLPGITVYLYALILVWFATSGAGALSLDFLLFKKK